VFPEKCGCEEVDVCNLLKKKHVFFFSLSLSLQCLSFELQLLTRLVANIMLLVELYFLKKFKK
jgi:hypothetical protein